MSYHPLSTVTGSVKLIAIVASRGIELALLRGSVANTAGPISTIGAVRRGLGTPVRKSAELLSVSVAPLFLRKSAVELLSTGAGEPSAQLAPAEPTKSTRPGSVIGHGPVSASKLLTSATLPLACAMFISPVTFEAGRAAPTAPLFVAK